MYIYKPNTKLLECQLFCVRIKLINEKYKWLPNSNMGVDRKKIMRGRESRGAKRKPTKNSNTHTFLNGIAIRTRLVTEFGPKSMGILKFASYSCVLLNRNQGWN